MTDNAKGSGLGNRWVLTPVRELGSKVAVERAYTEPSSDEENSDDKQASGNAAAWYPTLIPEPFCQ